MDAIDAVYLVCAIGAGFALLLQALLIWFEFGPQPGLHHDSLGHMGANLLQAGLTQAYPVVVALFVAGLVGVVGSYRSWDELLTGAAALGAGAATLGLGVSLQEFLARLDRQGHPARLQPLVGRSGEVGQAIPGERQGEGTVRLVQHRREVEYRAVTARQPLPSGSRVVVVAIVGPDLLEVGPDTDYDQVWQTFLTPAASGPQDTEAV